MKAEVFYENFRSEEQCINELVEYRLKSGIICRKCESQTAHTWMPKCKRFYCNVCLHQTTLRSGTVMESSKLPIKLWFYAMYLMTSMANPISCSEMCRQLDHRIYRSIWFMMQKIRALMGQRDSKYLLKEVVEMDDAFVTTFREKLDCETPLFTRGRGSQKQTKMFVMAESIPDSKRQKSTKPGYIRMVALANLSGDAAIIVAKENIEPDAIIKTDGYRGFNRLKKAFKNHQSKVIPAKRGHIDLPWVHTAIANVKHSISGIYRKISDRWIQNYLDENCYKFNRRFFRPNLFERLVAIAIIYNLN